MDVTSASLCKRLLFIIQHILLLPLLTTADGVENLTIRQIPKAINISEGDTATLKCSWTINQSESVRVDWLQNSDTIFTKPAKGQYKFDRREYIIEENFSMLIISKAVLNDSGLYHCKVFVEIPAPIRRASGEGTLLIVFASQVKNYLIIWLLASISPIMLIVIVVACCCFRKVKNRRQNGNLSNLRRSSQLYVNNIELSQACQKMEAKSANIYKNALNVQQKKHQSANKVIEEKSSNELYQNIKTQ
ncbi:uncharacterized protein LOC132805451 [Hemiscyllium ocellatum]|uniref:uncharacterized protein LOC132805451 n=1 Tax=Hemiscyllium ocellatum TaxID=170820 RepID=UPI0029668DF0|nr:uncharacterized protein LOC132805451 [Hemiscyllium ocellatum]